MSYSCLSRSDENFVNRGASVGSTGTVSGEGAARNREDDAQAPPPTSGPLSSSRGQRTSVLAGGSSATRLYDARVECVLTLSSCLLSIIVISPLPAFSQLVRLKGDTLRSSTFFTKRFGGWLASGFPQRWIPNRLVEKVFYYYHIIIQHSLFGTFYFRKYINFRVVYS